MQSNTMARLLPTAVLLALSGSTLWAQYTSALEGTVRDPSGAAVPNATVTLTDLQDNNSRSVTTSESGHYRFDSIAAANYSVTAIAPSFQKLVQENVRVDAASIRTVDLNLQVGAASTEITVSTEPPQIETAQSGVSGLIEQRQVADLPLPGRNFYGLVVLTPGITGLPSGGGQAYAQANADVFSPEYSVNMNASGLRTESNSFLIDSAPVNSGPRRGVVNIDPNAEDVQELRVNVNDYDAEYGGNAGALVNVITRSGGNAWHGSASWFHTDNVLQSRTEFQPQVPVYRRNEGSGSLGGPIWKDHTFFFVSTDILKSGFGTGSIQTVPTPQFISFMQANDPSNISTKVMSSYPASITPNQNVTTAGQLLGANCSSSPTLIPSPVGQIPCNLPVTGQGEFAVTVPRNGDQWTVRGDQFMNGFKDRLYVNVIRTDLDAPTASVYPAFSFTEPEHTFYGNMDETHTFSPNVLNEARYNFTRPYGAAPCADCQIPGISITGVTGYGVGFAPGVFVQNNYTWSDLVSVNRGTHSLKIGGGMQWVESNAIFQDVTLRPTFTFNSIFDFASDKPFSESFDIDPRTGRPSGANYDDRRRLADVFVQDDWKVRQNLTINLGLRWDDFGNFHEHSGLTTNIVFQGGDDFTSRIANAELAIVKNATKHDLNRNFAPKFGFAWDPTKQGKMSIRGGFGLFYDEPSDQFYPPGPGNPPVTASATASVQTPPYLPIFSLGTSSTAPFGFPLPNVPYGLNSKNGLLGYPAYVTVVDPNLKAAYSENWSLSLQRSLGKDWVAEANYVASLGRHLYAEYDVNRFDGDLIQNNGHLTRLNSSFGGIDYGQSNMNSSYQGFNAAVKNRTSFGLNTQIAYTFGRAIDQQSSSGGGLNVVDVSNLSRERGLADFDVRNKLAISLLWDVPHPSFSSKFLSTLTSGWELGGITILQSGSPYSVFCTSAFSPVRNAAGAIVGDSGCDYNADGFNYDYPNAPANGALYNGLSRSSFLNGVFPCNSSVAFCGNVFPAPALGQEGNLGRNTFIGPGYADSDLTAMKNTKIPWFLGNEGANLQFRAEFYNAFNRVNLTQVDGNLSDSTFGHSTNTFPARNVQFALRLLF